MILLISSACLLLSVESNGDVRILIRSSEMAVCAHAQYKFGPKQLRTTSATSGGLYVAMHSQLPRFLVVVVGVVVLIILLKH